MSQQKKQEKQIEPIHYQYEVEKEEQQSQSQSAKNDTQKTQTREQKTKQGKHKYPILSDIKLGELIDEISAGNSRGLAEKYRQSPQTISVIKNELKQRRRIKNERDILPPQYFSPKGIRDRVNNLLFEKGYKRLDEDES